MAYIHMHRAPKVEIRLLYSTLVSRSKDYLCDKLLIAVRCRTRTSWMWQVELSSLNPELKPLKTHAMPLPGSAFTKAFWLFFKRCMEWIHLSNAQKLTHGGILIDAIFTTMIQAPLIHFRYRVLASSLARTLGAILSCTSLFCHLALPIFVAHCDPCVKPVLKTASQLLCSFTRATCGIGDFVTTPMCT